MVRFLVLCLLRKGGIVFNLLGAQQFIHVLVVCLSTTVLDIDPASSTTPGVLIYKAMQDFYHHQYIYIYILYYHNS